MSTNMAVLLLRGRNYLNLRQRNNVADHVEALMAEVATLKEHLAMLDNANASISADNRDLRAEARTARELMYDAQRLGVEKSEQYIAERKAHEATMAERDAALQDAKDFDSLTVLHDHIVAERDRLKTALEHVREWTKRTEGQPGADYLNGDDGRTDGGDAWGDLDAIIASAALASNPLTEEGG